jgi:hypothetical protein
MTDMLEGRAFFAATMIQPTSPAVEQGLFDALIAQADNHCAI